MSFKKSILAVFYQISITIVCTAVILLLLSQLGFFSSDSAIVTIMRAFPGNSSIADNSLVRALAAIIIFFMYVCLEGILLFLSAKRSPFFINIFAALITRSILSATTLMLFAIVNLPATIFAGVEIFIVFAIIIAPFEAFVLKICFDRTQKKISYRALVLPAFLVNSSIATMFIILHVKYMHVIMEAKDIVKEIVGR